MRDTAGNGGREMKNRILALAAAAAIRYASRFTNNYLTMKKVLGVLGGMGPLATVDFLRKLIEETPAVRDEDHIPVVVYSVPQIPSRPPAITGNGESPLPAMLEASPRAKVSRSMLTMLGTATGRISRPGCRSASRGTPKPASFLPRCPFLPRHGATH